MCHCLQHSFHLQPDSRRTRMETWVSNDFRAARMLVSVLVPDRVHPSLSDVLLNRDPSDAWAILHQCVNQGEIVTNIVREAFTYCFHLAKCWYLRRYPSAPLDTIHQHQHMETSRSLSSSELCLHLEGIMLAIRYLSILVSHWGFWFVCLVRLYRSGDMVVLDCSRMISSPYEFR